MSEHVRTDYLNSIFDPAEFADTVKRAKRLTWKAQQFHQFDFIVFTGNSGAAIAGILADYLSLPLTCVRKSGDNSHFAHDGGVVEGWLRGEQYLFVDDFICTGNSFKKVRLSLEDEIPDAECAAILLYSSGNRSSYDGIPVYSGYAEHVSDLQISFAYHTQNWNAWDCS